MLQINQKVIRRWVYDMHFLAIGDIYLAPSETEGWNLAYKAAGMIDCRIMFSLRTNENNTINRQMIFDREHGMESYDSNYKELQYRPSIPMADRDVDQTNMKNYLACENDECLLLLEPERLNGKSYLSRIINRKANTIAITKEITPIVSVAKKLQKEGKLSMEEENDDN